MRNLLIKSKIINLSIVFFALFSLYTFCGCSGKSDKTEERRKAIEDYAGEINMNPVFLDNKKADTLINLYRDFVKDFPKDSLSDYYLFQAANVYASVGQCDSALSCLQQVIDNYPDGQRVGAAYFFKGVYLKDVCQNASESTEAFKTYIKKFPNSSKVEWAEQMILINEGASVDILFPDGKNEENQ